MKKKINGNVLVYTRPRLNIFLKKVANHLFDREIIAFSDFPGLEKINLMNTFYKYYKLNTTEQHITTHDMCQIITRCRVLRLLPTQQAERMVHAMYQVITELIEKYNPSYFMSQSVDNYILDIFYRVCERHGVFTIMLCGGSIPNTIIVTRYGEKNKVRTPTEAEIDSALKILLDDNHRITYSQKFYGYSFFDHFRNFVQWWLKYLVFKILSWVKADPLNYRYLAAFFHTLDQGQTDLSNYQGIDLFESDWEYRLGKASPKPSLFIPLAYVPEMTVDYWLKDLTFLRYEEFIINLCKKLSCQYLLVIKEHWAMLGIRRTEFYQKLKSIPNLILVPADVNSRTVMKHLDIVLVGAGTAGIEAAIRGKRVITMCTPYYYLNGYYLCLNKAEQIEELPKYLESFIPPPITKNSQQNLVHSLLESTISGSILLNSQLNTEENIQTTSESLKEYLLTLGKN
ncbi:capsular polysaccharide export protein, LipB/KpsS family [Coleofasciculus sp. G2-EDA-02]|uniref:capsular polysaccharide export protein, LipB/KpsS family n=1 Tax=Coleofasciculus sp. G2-EDA-02 TaxID=3069529 RepID=UPI0032FAA7C6